VLYLALIPIGAYVALVALTYVFQHQLVFFPASSLRVTPDAYGLVYEDVSISTADGETLHSWWIPHVEARGTVVFFHGNAGNISGRVGTARFFHEHTMNVLLVSYRGYGQSTGSPSEDGLYRDAEAAWQHLTEERGVAPASILIAGRSLGSAPATYLAAHTAPGGLLLESAFTSLPDVGARAYPILPVRWLSRFHFDNAARIAQVDAPVLMIHSPDDEVVPYDLGRTLFAAASEPKTFVDIRGGHNAMRTDQSAYQQAVRAFIDEHWSRE
jgi:fermentation-respiration switch protein FrsA (DUF1100 family)